MARHVSKPHVLKPKPQVSLEMARATHTKAQSLQDMMAQQLFDINNAGISNLMAHEYYT